LCAIFPQEEVDRRVHDLRWRLRMGAGLSLIAALLVGILLAQALVRPMEDLSVGIASLARKDFETQVPVRQRDEFGLLAHAFNQMTIELKDLNMAGAVQSSLIPHGYPQVSGYSLDGKVVFAGDLGGDCLDCRPLPDGRIFFLIGDVSGHGAASALIMAFTRATVTLWISEGRGDLSRLANRLQTMLSSLPGRRLFLALFCGILDSQTHRIDGLCAGHPFPITVSDKGLTRFHGLPAYPLGSHRGSRGGVPVTLQLEPHEVLLLYTDGLIEARDVAGDELGYSGLESLLQATVAHSVEAAHPAAEVLQVLVQQHRRRSPSAEDDVSLLAIVRRGGGTA
ncbi:MAG TPA: SpoIIE family protein phosphatase, partial [Candidatus Ozemobacteraceae bacterium]|nr:SpoIIE family protein phosphatase [Candidatus Ozemobacteraceae bacterium]